MKDLDWTRITDDLLESLVFTQSDLAERCKVTQQSISNWKNGLRSPGVFARERLLELLNEANLVADKYCSVSGTAIQARAKKNKPQLPEDVVSFANRLSKHSKKRRSEAIALADFLLSRN
jgi:transcriptional regulator with XRE-family HTH domain